MNFRRNLKSTSYYLFLGVCLIFVGLVIFRLRDKSAEVVQPVNSPTPRNILTEARVIKVFDGDTIEIEGGQKVRYIGIDAAEVYPTQQCFSNESLIKNRELVLGKTVRLEKDISETDKYGRLLRFVYVGDTFIDDYLVRNGYAKIMTIPPDVKYQNQFLDSEKYAKENNLGLWSKCF